MDKVKSSQSETMVLKIKDEQNSDTYFDNRYSNEVKIIELSNIIDKWEETVLFSEKGFYSLKGKDVEGKSKEFISELESLINSKIEEMSFSEITYKMTAENIKKEKIAAITNKMQIYEMQELKKLEISIYETALESSVKRAVLYKNDEDVILSSFKNGLSVLSSMKELLEWNSKVYAERQKEYKSRFYYSLIKAFMEEKDINAYKYYMQCKDYIYIDNKEELEKSLNNLKINIIAYNWAKEIILYELTDAEQETELNKINDTEIKNAAKHYLEDLIDIKKKQNIQLEREEKEKNWKSIISAVENNQDKSLLYIDYTLNKEHINAVKQYIKQIKKDGFIKTDETEFIKLAEEVFQDFNKYRQKDILNYRACLSDEDYSFFEKIKSMSESEIQSFKSDYEYSLKILNTLNIEDYAEKYKFVKLVINSLSEFKAKNDKNPDLVERNKLIDSVCERFKKVKE